MLLLRKGLTKISLEDAFRAKIIPALAGDAGFVFLEVPIRKSHHAKRYRFVGCVKTLDLHVLRPSIRLGTNHNLHICLTLYRC